MRVYQRNRSPILSRREAKYATRYMASLIMSKQLVQNLTLHIEFVKDCIEKDTKKKIQADCMWLDDNACPREFKIRINSGIKWKKKQLLALAHELVHVKQYASRDMRDVFRGPTNVKWKKEFVHEHKMVYWDLPWEIEAFGREGGMYIRYMDHLKDEKMRFD